MRIGLRLRLLLVFLASFAVMVAAILFLLGRSVGDSYHVIEERDIRLDMSRVAGGMEARLQALESQTADWAVWNDMYDFASNPGQKAQWAKGNIGQVAMESADLALVLLFDIRGKVVFSGGRDHDGNGLNFFELAVNSYSRQFAVAPEATRCGLVNTQAGLMMVCWARITKGDKSGRDVGTVVLGRLMDDHWLESARKQIGLQFDIVPNAVLPQGFTPLRGVLLQGRVGGADVFRREDAYNNQLVYELKDILEQPLGYVALSKERDAFVQGNMLYAQVRWQLVVTALLMAGLLGLAVHFLMVRRLRTLRSEMLELAGSTDWRARVTVQGQDEIGGLARQINVLLEVIAGHVAELNDLAVTDPLTGLPNRRAFDLRLEQEWHRRERTHAPLAMLMLDVDYFKRYNDFYGHPAGDAALKSIAEVLRASTVRAVDLCARIGGEEFVLLLPDTDAEGAMQMAARVRDELARRALPHARSDVGAFVTASVGVAVARDEPVKDFVRRADQALYLAKQAGRDRAVIAD